MIKKSHLLSSAMAALLAAGVFACTGPDRSTQPVQPNIVIIFADDQGYGDLGSYGSKTIRSPRLDQLAAEGTRFTDFYSQPVCGPARSVLLTGRYHKRSHGWSMPASEITFAELLKSVGYTTGLIGKWDVSDRKYILGRVPNDKGFDYYWGPLGANDGGGIKLYDNRNFIGEDRDMASLTQRYTDKAIDFIKSNTSSGKKNKPFLLYLAHTMAHVVIDATPPFKGRSKNGLYCDVIEELDYHTGRLLNALDEMGLRENTLVIFTSDNGPWSNDQEKQHGKNSKYVKWSEGPEEAWGSPGALRGAKGSAYEGGSRVPCIVRWPGKVPDGRVSNAIFSTLDMLPTFGNLAGYDLPNDRIIDGVDQTDLLLGNSETGARSTFFYDQLRKDTVGVRSGKWKLLLPDRDPGENAVQRYVSDFGTNGLELYDLEADIGEKNNLTDQYPEIVKNLQALIAGSAVTQLD